MLKCCCEKGVVFDEKSRRVAQLEVLKERLAADVDLAELVADLVEQMSAKQT